MNSQVHTLGCDYCGPLVEIARNRGGEVMVCDNLNLPFRDQGFDAIISIGGKAARPQSHFALKSTVRPIISCDSMSILCKGLGNAFYLILKYIYILVHGLFDS